MPYSKETEKMMRRKSGFAANLGTGVGARCIVPLRPLIKNRLFIKSVIPAKPGIQLFHEVLDPGFRRGDASGLFFMIIKYGGFFKNPKCYPS
jgi:hypothetical protein